MKHLLFALAVLILIFCSVCVQAEPARDPFITPRLAENPHLYEEALQKILVMGIVRAPHVERIIVKIEGLDELAVFRRGDTFAIKFQGRPHEFTVKQIKTKSVWFEARPKKSNAQETEAPFSYEVFLI